MELVHHIKLQLGNSAFTALRDSQHDYWALFQQVFIAEKCKLTSC